MVRVSGGEFYKDILERIGLVTQRVLSIIDVNGGDESRKSVMSLGRKIGKNGCASADLTRCKRPKIYAIRDFPIGCGPPKRFCTDTCRSINLLEVPVKGHDSNPEGRLVDSCDEKVEVESVRKVRLGETKVLDDAGLVNQSKTSDDESTDFQKKAMVRKAKCYPCRRRISAVRCFPLGCGIEAARINTEVVPESAAMKTNGLSHKIPGLEMALFKMKGEATERHEHQKNAASVCDRNMFQSEIECWRINREKQSENGMDECSDGKLSGQHHRVNQLLERVPSGLERPARVIVHALMAPSKCTWTRRTTAFTANTKGRRYAPLNVEPLKSDSLISAAVKLALLHRPFGLAN
ncbi:unnamed protein product [Dovyalis caffra]|uniref:Uncharacterized protein n=1 Tax=Dovyalis caffra TaxID=77055 RepID=A0AAV1SS32_9ROSI|nr:unnamed protein product [Dovyalis caffra]